MIDPQIETLNIVGFFCGFFSVVFFSIGQYLTKLLNNCSDPVGFYSSKKLVLHTEYVIFAVEFYSSYKLVL